MSTTPLTDKAAYMVNGERVVGAGLATILEIAFNTAQAECDNMRARGSWAHTCIHHTDDERKSSGHVCPVCLTLKVKTLEASK